MGILSKFEDFTNERVCDFHCNLKIGIGTHNRLRAITIFKQPQSRKHRLQVISFSLSSWWENSALIAFVGLVFLIQICNVSLLFKISSLPIAFKIPDFVKRVVVGKNFSNHLSRLRPSFVINIDFIPHFLY